MNKTVQIITTPSGEKMAIMPLAVFEALEDAADIAAVTRFKEKLAAGEEELLPADLVDRILDGENAIRAFRKYRGMKAVELADLAGISQPYLSDLETGKRTGTVDTLQRIATALRVDLEMLLPK